jgi:hypothetical protein
MKNTHIFTAIFFYILFTACSNVPRKVKQLGPDIAKHGIVFRLQDYKQRIDYFEKQGKPEVAKAEAEKSATENRRIVQLFREHFKFTKVNFVFSSQSDALDKGQPVLLNSNLEPDATIPLPEKIFIFSYGKDDKIQHTFGMEGFRLRGEDTYIRPSYTTWKIGTPLQARDIKEFDRVLRTW